MGLFGGLLDIGKRRAAAGSIGASSAGDCSRRRPGRQRPGRRRVAAGLERLEGRLALSTFLVSNLNDSGAGSLRQAIVASDGTPGPNEIDFIPGLRGTITLTGGPLTIANNDVTIVGPGADVLSVSGDDASRVFEVDGVHASLDGLTITGGRAGAGADGGGLANNGGTVTIAGCTLSGNSAPGGDGGALSNENGPVGYTLTTLASFNGADGYLPSRGLVSDAQGDLYGIAEFGGSTNQGTIFELAAGSHTITTLASFDGADGAEPSGLVRDAQGDLFGTTAFGGPTNQGTVFEVAAGSDTITTLVGHLP